VVRLVLDHLDDRVGVGVRPVEHEQVREARRRDALVGLGTLAPGVGDREPAAAGDVDRREELRRGEAGGQDQRVEPTLAAA